MVHTVIGTAANEADINQAAALLHGQETDVFADAGYTGADKRPEFEDREVVLEHRGQAQRHQGVARTAAELGRGSGAGAVTGASAWVEHPFHIVKNLFRHKKLRYRGLAKNTAQLHTLFALANLVIVKKALLAQGRV